MNILTWNRSEDVTGHVTTLALSAVHKFLAYDMIGEQKCNDLFKRKSIDH